MSKPREIELCPALPCRVDTARWYQPRQHVACRMSEVGSDVMCRRETCSMIESPLVVQHGMMTVVGQWSVVSGSVVEPGDG